MKYVSPSVNETAFNCPHCGALTTQFWFELRANDLSEENPKPSIINMEDKQNWTYEHIEHDEIREHLVHRATKLMSGIPFFEHSSDGFYSLEKLNNVNISRCYNCKKLAIWIHEKLVYPARGNAPPANPDLPEEIRQDYEEASSILDLSPRGAAALIRLGIQKLCKELGQPGENINADIAKLVAAGLDPRIQKALDAVRVIGNNAVHPGQIELRDDRATAESLFRLLNLITEKMISEPKHVDEVYSLLPEGARKAIEKRDGKK